MPKYGGVLRVAIEDNSRRKCKVSSCQDRRWRVSGYCRKHNNAKQNWGHPLGSNISARELSMVHHQVSQIIDLNRNHKGIKEGLHFFETWMRQATFSLHTPHPLVPVANHLVRAYDAKANPVDMLKVVASVWLYYDLQNHNPRIYNDEHCRAVMGNKICRFVPVPSTERQVTGKERKTAGKYIQDSIGVLLVNITKAVRQHEVKQQDRLRNMNSELNIDTVEKGARK